MWPKSSWLWTHNFSVDSWCTWNNGFNLVFAFLNFLTGSYEGSSGLLDIPARNPCGILQDHGRLSRKFRLPTRKFRNSRNPPRNQRIISPFLSELSGCSPRFSRIIQNCFLKAGICTNFPALVGIFRTQSQCRSTSSRPADKPSRRQRTFPDRLGIKGDLTNTELYVLYIN